jgi:hypothetical protein
MIIARGFSVSESFIGIIFCLTATHHGYARPVMAYTAVAEEGPRGLLLRRRHQIN